MKPTYIIGFDIGGTYLRGALFSGHRVVRSVVRKTPRTKKAFTRALQAAIKILTPKSGTVRGVRIGIAGVISGTKLLHSPNVKLLEGLDLRNSIPIGIKLKVDNDARCFLRGQPGLTTRYKNKRVLGITLGTGVGRALAVNGKVKPIKRFEQAEVWEPEYQKRRRQPSSTLATYLSRKLTPTIKHYHVDAVVIGGGVVAQKPALSRLLMTAFGELGLGVTITHTTPTNWQAARGATLTLN